LFTLFVLFLSFSFFHSFIHSVILKKSDLLGCTNEKKGVVLLPKR
jgi:hypothetical protein